MSSEVNKNLGSEQVAVTKQDFNVVDRDHQGLTIRLSEQAKADYKNIFIALGASPENAKYLCDLWNTNFERKGITEILTHYLENNTVSAKIGLENLLVSLKLIQAIATGVQQRPLLN